MKLYIDLPRPESTADWARNKYDYYIFVISFFSKHDFSPR